MRHVIIAGLTASGKTTQSVHLATSASLHYVSGSAIRSRLLDMSGNVAANPQFWRDSADGASLDLARLSRSDIKDKAVDNALIEIARNSDNCVFDAWVMPWLFREESICVFLKSSLNTRARRLFRIGLGSFDEALRKVSDKDKRTRDFFLKAYRIDIFRDLTPFDLIIECDEKDDEATESIAEIRDQLSAIVRPALSGDHAALQGVVRSLNNRSGIVKTHVRASLFERLAEKVPA